MPKDPKRNLQSYQIQGGHLNEFEFQKSQGQMAEESRAPVASETAQPDLSEADRIAAVTAEAHRKVEKRKKRGVSKAVGQRDSAPARRSSKKASKKAAGKPAKKVTARTGAKKRGQRAAGKKAAKKPAPRAATKSVRKTTKRAATKKRAGVKS